MVLVSADTFLAKVTELYTEQTATAKGSIALTCKSGACPLRKATLYAAADARIAVPVPARKIARGAAPDDRVLLFRVRKYGNNKHKKKYSTTVHCCICAALRIIREGVLTSSRADHGSRPCALPRGAQPHCEAQGRRRRTQGGGAAPRRHARGQRQQESGRVRRTPRTPRRGSSSYKIR